MYILRDNLLELIKFFFVLDLPDLYFFRVVGFKLHVNCSIPDPCMYL